jgi:hypothetical protein
MFNFSNEVKYKFFSTKNSKIGSLVGKRVIVLKFILKNIIKIKIYVFFYYCR